MKWRTPALLAAASLVAAPLGGCTSNDSRVPPPVDDSASGRTQYGAPAGRAPEASRPKMSTGKKLVILGGAAALYYMYKHHQSAAVAGGGQGQQGQYYLSKNGRVYYRDAEHRAHWVTPPQEGISVPADEAAPYSGLKGYDNQASGSDLTDVPEARNATE